MSQRLQVCTYKFKNFTPNHTPTVAKVSIMYWLSGIGLQFKCCGVYNFTDWDNYEPGKNGTVPPSCLKNNDNNNRAIALPKDLSTWVNYTDNRNVYQIGKKFSTKMVFSQFLKKLSN